MSHICNNYAVKMFKYLEMNLTNYVKVLCDENCKSFMKEIMEDKKREIHLEDLISPKYSFSLAIGSCYVALHLDRCNTAGRKTPKAQGHSNSNCTSVSKRLPILLYFLF